MADTAMRLDRLQKVDDALMDRLVAHADGKVFGAEIKKLKKGAGVEVAKDGDDLVKDLGKAKARRR